MERRWKIARKRTRRSVHTAARQPCRHTTERRTSWNRTETYRARANGVRSARRKRMKRVGRRRTGCPAGSDRLGVRRKAECGSGRQVSSYRGNGRKTAVRRVQAAREGRTFGRGLTDAARAQALRQPRETRGPADIFEPTRRRHAVRPTYRTRSGYAPELRGRLRRTNFQKNRARPVVDRWQKRRALTTWYGQRRFRNVLTGGGSVYRLEFKISNSR